VSATGLTGGPIPATGLRHLTFANVDAYWGSGFRVEIPLPGSPPCRLRMDASHDEISLVTPVNGPEPDVARYRNIHAHTFVRDDQDWTELRVTVAGSLHAAFSVLADTADRLQLGGESVAVAVARALEAQRGVYAGRAALGQEQEIGLYGELLLFEFLAARLGGELAVDTWSGPLSEEHDFAFVDCHLEVKTTTGEQRRHVIGQVRQLEPLRGIPLWLVSVQITRTSRRGGRTLTRLVSEAREAAGDARAALDDRLRAAGWDDDVADLYPTVWTQRSTPRCYRVDDRFPALTQARLTEVVPQPSLLSDVSYRVDVTNLHFDDVPQPLQGFVETEE
jgi:Putative  PD-(D/E)XK family member, (DUF4420)